MSRYIIRYQGACDPTAREERRLLASLKDRVRVLDRMPGMWLVDGSQDVLAEALAGQECWRVTPEQTISTRPPHKHLKPV